MKIGIFTDSHFSSAEVTCGNRYNNKSFEKIKEAYQFFVGEKCDLVVCLGDLIDREDEHIKEIENLEKISKLLTGYDIESRVVMGNHDAFAFDVDEFYSILGEKFRPENMSVDNKNLIFLDTCYFKNGNHYKPGDTDWTDTYYPMAEELKKLLHDIDGQAYIFMHQNVDSTIREDHRVYNSDDLHAIFKNSKKVKTVFQGHFHPGFSSVHDGIKYITYPAMCENDGAYYVVEI